MARKIHKTYKLTVEPTWGEKEHTPPLPKFKPIKLGKVIRTITGKSGRHNVTSEVTTELLVRVDAQQAELFRAMGIDGENPDWADAFLELARIHHGVGVIHLEKDRASNKHAAKWTREQDDALLAALNSRLAKGATVTAALQDIANDKTLSQLFPSAKNSRSKNSPASRRFQSFKKRVELIKKRDILEHVQNEISATFAKGRVDGTTKKKQSKKRVRRPLGKI